MRMPLFFHFLFVSSALAAPVDSSASSTPTATSVAPLSTACADIVSSCGALEDLPTFPRFKLTINADLIFTAQQAFDCLSSVPFNPGVATQFLTYYTDTLQFQSTSAYLKNPPASYQQPAVDLLHGLSQIQLDINNGVFENQYAFEATLQRRASDVIKRFASKAIGPQNHIRNRCGESGPVTLKPETKSCCSRTMFSVRQP